MGPNALSLFNLFFIKRLSAGLLHHETIVFNLAPGIAKIAPWCLARLDSSLRSGLEAKVPELVAGVTAPPTLSAFTRGSLGVIVSFLLLSKLIYLDNSCHQDKVIGLQANARAVNYNYANRWVQAQFKNQIKLNEP